MANLATSEGNGAAARTAGDGEAIFLGYLAWQQRHCQSVRRRYVRQQSGIFRLSVITICWLLANLPGGTVGGVYWLFSLCQLSVNEWSSRLNPHQRQGWCTKPTNLVML